MANETKKLTDILILWGEFEKLEYIKNLSTRANEARHNSIKIVFSECVCNKCIDRAYFMHNYKFLGII